MKTPDEIIEYIALRIGYVYYHRPLMYGGDGEGVDLLLHTYHTIWSEIVERHAEFQATCLKVSAEEKCGAANFATRYKMNHPQESEQEIAAYVVQQWRKISDCLSVPLDHAFLKREFE